MIRATISTLIILFATLVPDLARAESVTLAGRAFEISCKAPDGKEEKDTLVFTATDADATACHAYGFGNGAVSYAPNAATITDAKNDKATKDNVTQTGNGVVFSFTTTSAKEGTIVWKGAVIGAAVSGTMSWTKAGKTTAYTFTGTESEKKERQADKTGDATEKSGRKSDK